MKNSQWIGIVAAILLIVSCFLPWTFHPDLNKNFNGFFSENNIYGKPGTLFSGFAVLAIIFFAIRKLWAKRWNLLVTAMTTAWAIRSFVLFSGCYKGICPEKKAGLWLMLIASCIMMLMAFLPDTRVKNSDLPDQN